MFSVMFDANTSYVPMCCGNCEKFRDGVCTDDHNDGVVLVEEDEKPCIYFKWEEAKK